MSTANETWIAAGFTLAPFLQVDWPIAYKRSMAVVLENIGSDEQRTFLGEVRGGPVCPVVWSPDGRTLCTARESEIVAIDSVDGGVRAVAPARVTWVLEASPRGDSLIFRDDVGMGNLRSVNLATGSFDLLIPHVYSATVDWVDRVAYTIGRLPPAASAVWRVGLDAFNSAKLVELEGCGRLSLSHDRRLLALSDGAQIRTVDVQTGETRTTGRGNAPSWCPVRRELAFGNEGFGDGCVSVQSETGNPSVLFAAPGERPAEARTYGWGGRPSWSPDGRFLAVTACRATFDPAWFTRADPSDMDRHPKGWTNELKRAVFDFERREVIVRDGYWSDVAWQPRTGA